MKTLAAESASEKTQVNQPEEEKANASGHNDPSQSPGATKPDGPNDNSQQPQAKRGRKVYFVVFGVILLLSAAIGVFWWIYAQGREETDDSYVDGHITSISSRVVGTVAEVLVEDNQVVNANQPLVRLDPRDYQVSVDKLLAAMKGAERKMSASQRRVTQSDLSAKGQATQATGNINSSEADVERAKAAFLAAQAEEHQAASHVKEQEAQVAFAHGDYERYKIVYANRAVTKQQFDRALQSVEVQEAQLKEAQDALNHAQRQVLQAQAEIKAATARQLTSQGQYTSAVAAGKQTDIDKEQYRESVTDIDQAKSDLEEARLKLSYTKIDAPVAGKVGRKSVEVGQKVEAGQSLMAIVQPNPWVTANFKETQLTKMKVGQEAEIKIDSFPGRTFRGHVDSLSPASGAKFSLLPPDNATGNFTKVVQRIPVKIVFDKGSLGEYESRISPGMSCSTTVTFK